MIDLLRQAQHARVQTGALLVMLGKQPSCGSAVSRWLLIQALRQGQREIERGEQMAREARSDLIKANLRLVIRSATRRRTLLGMFSTRAKQDTTGSWPSAFWRPNGTPIEQFATTAVVVPWRTTSLRPGSSSTSRSR